MRRGFLFDPFQSITPRRIISACLISLTVFFVGCGDGESPSTDAAQRYDTISDAVLWAALATPRNGAYFWTGKVNGVSVEATAGEIAARAHGSTLESRLAAAHITTPPMDDRSAAAVGFWTKASKFFAERARGTVFLVAGTEIREHSVWTGIEFPQLRNNTEVLQIIKIVPDKGVCATYWRRYPQMHYSQYQDHPERERSDCKATDDELYRAQ